MINPHVTLGAPAAERDANLSEYFGRIRNLQGIPRRTCSSFNWEFEAAGNQQYSVCLLNERVRRARMW